MTAIAPDPWWVEGRSFVVYARHKHTDTVCALAAFDDKRRAQAYVSEVSKGCSSHDEFVLVDYTAPRGDASPD